MNKKKQSTINNYQLAIVQVLKYFSFFAYQPTLEEIHTFLPAKISKNELKEEIERMVRQKSIVNCQLSIDNSNRYTPVEYSISKAKITINNQQLTINNALTKYDISQSKLNSSKFKLYIKLLSIFPQIKLVGLSGSITMMNANEDDDIDLFIITARNRLFTGRLVALILAQLLGLRRDRKTRSQNFLVPVGTLPAPSAGVSQVVKNYDPSLSFNNETMKQCNNLARNKVCLNLFFDENNLKVPKFKQTVFVGHEVLQMKPVINKDQVYERFLKANNWVFMLFPNAKSQIINKYYPEVIPAKAGIQTKITLFGILNKIELVFKKLQLNLINRHKTTEIITSTQLWFHPDDFGKKINTD